MSKLPIVSTGENVTRQVLSDHPAMMVAVSSLVLLAKMIFLRGKRSVTTG